MFVDKEIISIVRSQFPTQAIDFADCIEMFSSVIEDTYQAVQVKMNQYLTNKDYDNAELLISFNKNLDSLEQYMSNLKLDLELDIEEIEKEEEKEVKSLPNYEKYYVDSKVSYTLYETFAHKRPFAFEFQGKQYEVRTWIEMLIKFCDLLYQKNSELFYSFPQNPLMNGKKKKYFSEDSSGFRKPLQLDISGIFIETNMSGESIRNLLVKMLRSYDYKMSDVLIFLKADYTDLHK